MKVWVTVRDGKVLLDAREPGSAPLVLEIGEAIDLASEMLGAAMIAQPVAEVGDGITRITNPGGQLGPPSDPAM